MRNKLLFIFILLGISFCIIQGCGQRPFACMTIEGNIDSIHVFQPVTFNGFCSSGANEFYWLINNDSVYFTPRVTLTFAAQGEQEIYLMVSSGNKTSATTKRVTVYP